MNRDEVLVIRLSEEEKNRLRELAGENMSEYVLAGAFKGQRESRVEKNKLPGWEVVERYARSGGIKVKHPNFAEAKILYPEDEAYQEFVV